MCCDSRVWHFESREALQPHSGVCRCCPLKPIAASSVTLEMDIHAERLNSPRPQTPAGLTPISTGEWIKRCRCVHTLEQNSATRRNKLLVHAKTWPVILSQRGGAESRRSRVVSGRPEQRMLGETRKGWERAVSFAGEQK